MNSINEKPLFINTIYPAFEGEGCWIGTPQVFIRFQGCAIGCINCDSKQTWSYKEHGNILTLEEVVSKAWSFLIPRFSITGGNPLDKKNGPACFALVSALKEKSCFVNVEATGQEWQQEIFAAVDWISLDIKTPGTGVKPRLDIIEQVLQNFAHKTQIKMVCQDQKDLEFILHIYQNLREKNLLSDYQLVITPAWENNSSSAQVAAWMDEIYSTLYQHPQVLVRVISQNHKWIYGPKKEDV